MSKIPPDVPLLPIDCYSTIQDAEFFAAQKKSRIVWCGAALIEKQLEDDRANDSADIWRL